MRPSGSGQTVIADDIDAAHTISEADSLFVSTTALLHRLSDYLPVFSALELKPSARKPVFDRYPKMAYPSLAPCQSAQRVFSGGSFWCHAGAKFRRLDRPRGLSGRAPKGP
jgi:hypothetical protein